MMLIMIRMTVSVVNYDGKDDDIGGYHPTEG